VRIVMDMKSHLKDYVKRAGATLNNSPFEKIAEAAALLLRARHEGNWIFAAGNGGSAATASHFANDFVKGLSLEGRKRFKCIALNDAVPILTALANDYDYSRCYKEQLINYASPGDIFVAYSGSGNSPNVVKAAEYAKSIGMSVISFTGRDGGKLDTLSDVGCIAPTECMEEIEDVHMVWEHALVVGLRTTIAEMQE
jgi:D-sedoheptulose 7-phosphate isomerase